jgi:beta-lactamase regulating signal transducer with metallopeptidase domain
MMLLVDWLHTLGAASIDWVWRPLLAWTLAGLPVYLGLRWWRNAPPLVRYHGYLALLLALPLGVALAPFLSWPASPAATSVVTVTPAASLADPPAKAAPIRLEEYTAPTAVPPSQASPGAPFWIGAVTVLAAGWAVFLVLRMLYLAYGLRRFRRGLTPVHQSLPHRLLVTTARQVGVREDVALYRSPDDTTPMTFGWRRPAIVLPETLLDDEEALRLTLVHELIHIRRRDYAIGWVVRLIGSLFAVHPGVWLLRREIDQYREISCDAETLGGAPVPRRQYVRLLLRFSPLTDLAGPTALRMVDLDSTLKKRINAMRTFVHSTSTVRLSRWSLPLAAVVLLIPAVLTACATENSSSETVIVTAEAAPKGQPVLVEKLEQRAAAERAEFEMQAIQQSALKQRLQVVQEKLVQEEANLAHLLLENPELKAQDTDVLRSHKMRIAQLQMELEKLTQQYAHEAQEREAMMREQERLQQAAARERERIHADQYNAQALKRLAVQMEYLQNEIKKLKRSLTDSKQQKELIEQGSYELTEQRLHLLNAMYMQRMEEFEQMKMEQFTRTALENLDG